MSVTAVVGCGWGDEGKGKIVDALASARGAKLVIRFNGGPNAGHTVVPEVDGGAASAPRWNRVVFRLHQVPSGVFTPGCVCVCGPGTVIDPDGFLAEIAELEAHGVDTERVLLSDRAHVVLPVHRQRDRLLEAAREGLAQGTTLRGVGPAYEDKVARIGLRLGDLLDREYLREYLPFFADEQSRRLAGLGGEPVGLQELLELCDRWADRIGNRIVDSYPIVRDALHEGGPIILEGQLGAGRDIDWGIYPYVTSSGATTGAAATGSGVPATAIREVVGVVKAFATSVGGGPLVTELFGAEAERLRTAGGAETEHEYGATTGRARRCGWFDAVAARQAAAINGCTAMAVTKLDALDGLPEVKIATAYELDGQMLDHVPSNTRRLAHAEPVYETLPGWTAPSREIREWDRLPEAARAYAGRIEALVGVPVVYAGTGPSRPEMAERGAQEERAAR
ncbi:MAG: adenylosuccinate synthase [Chloroflexi bacterium]|nr:adenylosuccinate synthase [Chloroflexota bacterium]